MFEFGNAPKQFDDGMLFKVPPLLGREDILRWYNSSMNFPYFGYNWDSLYDMLCDLSWISEKHVTIVHSDLPDLSKEDLIIYVGILFDAMSSWEHEEVHVLHVQFPTSYESEINSMTKGFKSES